MDLMPPCEERVGGGGKGNLAAGGAAPTSGDRITGVGRVVVTTVKSKSAGCIPEAVETLAASSSS